MMSRMHLRAPWAPWAVLAIFTLLAMHGVCEGERQEGIMPSMMEDGLTQPQDAKQDPLAGQQPVAEQQQQQQQMTELESSILDEPEDSEVDEQATQVLPTAYRRSGWSVHKNKRCSRHGKRALNCPRHHNEDTPSYKDDGNDGLREDDYKPHDNSQGPEYKLHDSYTSPDYKQAKYKPHDEPKAPGHKGDKPYDYQPESPEYKSDDNKPTPKYKSKTPGYKTEEDDYHYKRHAYEAPEHTEGHWRQKHEYEEQPETDKHYHKHESEYEHKNSYHQPNDGYDDGSYEYEYKAGPYYPERHHKEYDFIYPKHRKPRRPPHPPPRPPPGEPRLVLLNANTSGFLELDEPLQWLLQGGELLPGSVAVTVDGNALRVGSNSTAVVANATTITANISGLALSTSQKTNVSVDATTTSGKAVTWREELWFGNRQLLVTAVMEDDSPAVGAVVTVQVASDPSATASAVTDAEGQVLLTGLPGVSLFVSASGSDGANAVWASNYAVPANVPGVTLTLRGVPQPSPIDNNDIMNGTAGWDVDLATAGALTAEEHVEDISGLRLSGPELEALRQRTQRLEGAKGDAARARREEEETSKAPATHDAPTTQPKGRQPVKPAAEDPAYPNNDLVVYTSGIQGPVTATRTFQVPQGSGQVEIRYRFVTLEFPQWYGSKYDDAFSVTLISQKRGVVLQEGSSLNALPASAYTQTEQGGSTQWFTRKVQVDPTGDVVQVILSVANVGDSLYQSWLYVDYVTAGRVCIRPLDLLSWTTAVVHCYLDAVSATFGYDPDGVGPEKKPNAQYHSCVEVTKAGSEEIIAAANAVTPFYKSCPKSLLGSWTGFFCDPPQYNLVNHNCCHFVNAALTNAGSPSVVSYFPGYVLYPDVAEPPPPNGPPPSLLSLPPSEQHTSKVLSNTSHVHG